jgi:hypothetical protein
MATSLRLRGIERTSSSAHGLAKCCLKIASAPVPSGRMNQSDWMNAKLRS